MISLQIPLTTVRIILHLKGVNVILKGVFHQIYNVVNVVSVCINLFLNYQCPLPNYIFEIYEHSKISHRLILMVLDVTKYLNGKLKEKTEYVVFQRSFDKDGNYENEGFIQFATKSKLCWLVCLLQTSYCCMSFL